MFHTPKQTSSMSNGNVSRLKTKNAGGNTAIMMSSPTAVRKPTGGIPGGVGEIVSNCCFGSTAAGLAEGEARLIPSTSGTGARSQAIGVATAAGVLTFLVLTVLFMGVIPGSC